MNRNISLSLCLVALVSCGDPQDRNPKELAASESTQNLEKDSCSPATGSIASISSLIRHLNALTKPVAMDCFVRSLPRPLRLQATASVISVQPAISREQPRIFLESDGLFLSLVPGEQALEIGETWQRKYSIKGELQFPITEDLSDNAAFVGVGPLFGHKTRCGGPCHGETREYANVGGTTVYASQIVRPNPDLRVPIDELKTVLSGCSPSEACSTFEALFKESDPVPYEFAEDMPHY